MAEFEIVDLSGDPQMRPTWDRSVVDIDMTGIEPWAGGPEPKRGDTILIRGIFTGPDGPVTENCLVDVFSKTDQYQIRVRTSDVLTVGPDWWPPRAGDKVIDVEGGLWEFRLVDTVGLLAYTVGQAGQDIGGGNLWSGSRLLWRGGKPADY